jgi:type 1 glutamine amidotransferase
MEIKKTPWKPRRLEKGRVFYSSLGGHSGEGSVSASGFFPQEAAAIVANAKLKARKIFERKLLLDSMYSPFFSVFT